MGQRVEFASNGGTAEGYLAVPESGHGPGVIVIQEWWGLVPHIEDLCERLASEGFVALAPDLYHGMAAGEPDEAMRLMMGLAMDTAASDMAGAAQFLVGHEAVDGAAVGIVGFCMGGSLALWSAASSPAITAAVGFYPALPWERMGVDWEGYSGKSAQIHCSEEDGTSAAPGIQQAQTGITMAGGEVEVFDYPGTHHAFFNDTRPEVFDAAASARAWQAMVALFRDRLSTTA
jgi:carboxymethylenebutenolidase